MAATRSSELMRIFDDVILNNVSYCMLCLRTEKERRLVRPHYISMFVQSLNVPSSLQGSNKRVCYVCETQAASALRVRRAVSFAMSIELLFHNMTIRRKYQEDVRKHLTGVQISKDKFIEKRATEWERQLFQIREQTQLLQTEVLVVDSMGVQMSLAEPEESHEDVYVVPDASPIDHSAARPLETILSEPEIDVNSVIILDEDEDPTDVKPNLALEPDAALGQPALPNLVSIERLVEGPPAAGEAAVMLDRMQLLVRHPLQPNTFVLHPMAVGPDRHIAVPTLNAKIIDGRLVAAGPHPLAPSPGPPAPGPDPPAPGPDPPGAAGPQLRPSAETASTINCLSHVDDILEGILREKAAALGRSARTGKRARRAAERAAGAEVGALPPPPVPRPDKIDWEDKIPMDVISFMDATDPLAATELGYISDIRSLEPRPPDGAVIDLC